MGGTWFAKQIETWPERMKSEGLKWTDAKSGLARSGRMPDEGDQVETDPSEG